MNIIPIVYEPYAGTTIKRAFADALAMAWKKNRVVRMSFNGLVFKVHKRLSVHHLMNQWKARTHAAHLRYTASPEYKAEKERRRLEIIEKQEVADGLLEKLPNIINDLDSLMLWIKEFAFVADDIGVRFSSASLYDQLRAAGYKAGENVGRSNEWFNTRERVGRYVVGQVLSCLADNYPPHPICRKFVEQYFEIPKSIEA